MLPWQPTEAEPTLPTQGPETGGIVVDVDKPVERVLEKPKQDTEEVEEEVLPEEPKEEAPKPEPPTEQPLPTATPKPFASYDTPAIDMPTAEEMKEEGAREVAEDPEAAGSVQLHRLSGKQAQAADRLQSQSTRGGARQRRHEAEERQLLEAREQAQGELSGTAGAVISTPLLRKMA